MSTGLTGKASIDRPWLNYYPEPFKNVEVPKMTIEAFLRMKNPDQNRCVFEYYGNQFNFKYLYFLLIFKKKYIFNFMKRWIF